MRQIMDEPPCHVINNDLSPVAKGKRTKRLRPQSPIPFTVTNHRSSASADDGAATEEEEDIARCLILLAQGHFPDNTKINSDSATDKGGGAAVYACKTCDRVFSSFQALGGHRTSHKKPKIDDDFSSKKRTPPHTLSLQLSSSFAAGKPYTSPRIHECSYCGAEFTSGQALGGHMRRHRAVPISPVPGRVTPNPEPNKPRNGLSLDLNFPAPEDKFEFGSVRPENLVVATNAPALVDCHF